MSEELDAMGAPAAADMAKASKIPKLTAGRAALLGLMSRYLDAVMDPFISLLEIHKLMYFMQEGGERLRLRFVKGSHGPYSENLRHVLNVLEGHFIIGFGDAGDDPAKQIELTGDAAEQADAFLRDHPSSRARFDRVVDLIKGFETPYGMELIATVHWVALREAASSPAQAIDQVHTWNDRKRMFPAPHISLAWNVLKSGGWLA